MNQMLTPASDCGGVGGIGLPPDRVDRKAIHLPSGDHTGDRASGSSASSGRVLSLLPSASHSEWRSFFVVLSIQERTNTAFLPPGASTTDLGPSNRYRSSIASGRLPGLASCPGTKGDNTAIMTPA